MNGIRKAIARCGYDVFRIGHCNVLDFLLETWLRNTELLRFIQIGANDGRSNDPIYPFVVRNRMRVNGLVLEPVAEYFERLTRTYRNYPGITPIKLAIHRSERRMTIHRVDSAQASSLPKSRAGIASFDPAHHERTATPASVMTEEVVDCVTLAELLDRHDVRQLDLLLVDTEGYDAEIIRSIDFRSVKPKIIRFEHGRLKTMTAGDFQELRALLHEQGYELMIESRDVTAYLPEIVLHRLEPFTESIGPRGADGTRGL